MSFKNSKYGDATYSTYYVLIGRFSFVFAGTAKRHSRFLLAEFLLNFFASSSRSYLKTVLKYQVDFPFITS
jgi:hypothetical protein